MAANEEYPRGWTFQTNGNGAALSLVLPGVNNVSHVLDSASVKGANFSGGIAVAATAIGVAAVSGVLNLSIMAVYIPATSGAGQLTADSDSWVGPYVFPMGQSLTVSMAALTGFSLLRITGHDI